MCLIKKSSETCGVGVPPETGVFKPGKKIHTNKSCKFTRNYQKFTKNMQGLEILLDQGFSTMFLELSLIALVVL